MKNKIQQLRLDFSLKKYESVLKDARELKESSSELNYLDSLIRFCENKLKQKNHYDFDAGSQNSIINNIKDDKVLNLVNISKNITGNNYFDAIRKPGEHILSGNLSKVTIVIPVYNRNKILSMTLAAITHQTYPAHLIEVVVVDDGSTPGTIEIINKFEKLLDIKYYWHPDKGYRPGQARTAGMKLASSENIITLDCDMLPTKHLVAEFMYVLNRHRDRVLIGPRRYVCTDHLHVDDLIHSSYWIDTLPDVSTNNNVASGAWMGKKTVDWRHNFYKRTNFLKNSVFPFIAFASGNVAYPREAFLMTDGYDEEFEKWGSEDTEFGYRLFAKGYYMQPVMEALALHQEPPGGENEVDRKSGYVTTKDILKEKCPLYSREYEQDRKYAVPKYAFINNSNLNNEEFINYIERFNYADKVVLKNIDINQSTKEARTFLDKEKASFFIVINESSDLNIPNIIDNELKNLDQDLLVMFKKLNSKFNSSFDIIWRGQLERLLNFGVMV
jgi:glycosyltransferase involved in cell wall biosynthesis